MTHLYHKNGSTMVPGFTVFINIIVPDDGIPCIPGIYTRNAGCGTCPWSVSLDNVVEFKNMIITVELKAFSGRTVIDIIPYRPVGPEIGRASCRDSVNSSVVG